MSIRLIRSVLFSSVLLAVVMLALPSASVAQIGIAVSFGPPPIPVYEQPICPGDGYMWVPGYWAWDDGYYWVPGTWVLAPEVGFLWTPGWWGWGTGGFFWHAGYWGPHIGFYGGINYGFGYFGVGYEGGYWNGDHFFYNRSVTNVNITNIHNVYNKTVINNTTINRVSYNGGEGGITARATPQEEAAASERHIAPVAAQTQHMEAARSDPQMRASANNGKPPVAATARPGELHGSGAVPAREAGGPVRPESLRSGAAARPENAGRPENNVPRPGANAVHPNELPAREKPAPPNTGNPKLDQKYQQQQEKLAAKQEQERQNLQQKQEAEHQKATRQNYNDQQKQQMEARHQQQTQQLQQRHEQQQQRLQQRQAPPAGRPR